MGKIDAVTPRRAGGRSVPAGSALRSGRGDPNARPQVAERPRGGFEPADRRVYNGAGAPLWGAGFGVTPGVLGVPPGVSCIPRPELIKQQPPSRRYQRSEIT